MAVLLAVATSSGCGGFEAPTAPTPPPTTGNAVDMGNPVDEAHHALKGWGALNAGVTVPPEPGADRTSRYQLIRLPNSLELAIAEPARPFTLTFRTEDGSCDDSFDIYVNGHGPLLQYRHRQAADDFPVHRVPVSADVVPTTIVTVTFQNVAVDNCGFAAVYYVRVE
jgi:hypothetical protein